MKKIYYFLVIILMFMFVPNVDAKNYDKVVYIGDSRFYQASQLDTDPSHYYIAKSAMAYDWFSTTALKRLDGYLKNYSNAEVAVVINMGANDVVKTEAADKYVKRFKKLEKKYPNVDFYYMSLNPFISYYSDSNKQAKEFNRKIKSGVGKSKYIDTFNGLDFDDADFVDPVHYTNVMTKRIKNYSVKQLKKSSDSEDTASSESSSSSSSAHSSRSSGTKSTPTPTPNPKKRCKYTNATDRDKAIKNECGAGVKTGDNNVGSSSANRPTIYGACLTVATGQSSPVKSTWKGQIEVNNMDSYISDYLLKSIDKKGLPSDPKKASEYCNKVASNCKEEVLKHTLEELGGSCEPDPKTSKQTEKEKKDCIAKADRYKYSDFDATRGKNEAQGTVTCSQVINNNHASPSDFKAECENKYATCESNYEYQKKHIDENAEEPEETFWNKIFNPNVTYVCGGTISERLLKIIGTIYRTAVLIAFVAVIILGALDFLKATGASNADDLKIAWKRFYKRLIVMILLGILPSLLILMLNIFGLSNMTGCVKEFSNF